MHTWTDLAADRTMVDGGAGAWMTPSLTVSMNGVKTTDS